MKVLRPTTIPFPNNGQFIRNSTATYIEDGILKTAAINEPRWQDGELLLEGEATNLLTYSQDFSNGVWTKTRSSVSANVAMAPDGSASADRLTEDSSTGQHWVGSSVGMDSAVATIYAKADTRTRIGILRSSNSAGAVFDVSSGSVISTTSGYSASIESLAGGWYRCRCFGDFTGGVYFPMFSAGGALSYTGDGSGGLYIWGAQLEQSDSASSYIPTTTAPATRAADICIGNFSRASTATYIDDNGVLQTAGVNVPRIQNGKLLLEGEATNLLRQSSVFPNAVWVVNSATLTATTAAPEVLSTSPGIFAPNTVNTFHEMYQFFNTKTGDKICAKWVVKASGYNYVQLLFPGAISLDYSNFDLASGSIVAGTGTSTIRSLSNGWFLISIETTALSDSTTARSAFAVVSDGNAPRAGGYFAGNGTSGVIVGWCQVEIGTNTSYIPTTTTPVTRAADVHTAGLVYTNATDVRPLWSSATTYSAGQIIRYNNTIYESLQSTNLNRQPNISPTWWLSLGADNISAAFDGKVGSKTTATDKLRMIVYPGSVIDAVGYLETNASVVNTSVLDVNGNLAYSNSTGFTEANIENWYDYFFVSPLADPATQVVHQGIPSLDPGLFIGIEMINPGTVEVGSILTGYSTTIGKTQYGLKAGIVDYSKKESDEFGNVSIVERPYSKRMQGDVYVSNFDLNKVQRFLYGIRATPVLWMASDNPELAEVSYVYGFYKDFSTTISYPDVSMCNLDIEGLI